MQNWLAFGQVCLCIPADGGRLTVPFSVGCQFVGFVCGLCCVGLNGLAVGTSSVEALISVVRANGDSAANE